MTVKSDFYFEISTQVIDEACREKLENLVRRHSDGAVVTFQGVVRNHNEGKAVTALSYEACESLALNEAEKIFAEAKELFACTQAACIHRTGHLKIGDTAVFVCAASPHRKEAFAACHHIIDEIKHRLPIWKKETYQDGESAWVNCQNCQTGAHENHDR